jgi:hypothetical protein
MTISSAGGAALVFFLHVPRTAGRTYHSCFMKLGSPPSARCEKSYDVLRLNSSVTGCSLLGSHDDFSIRQHLPANTAVVTQLRCALMPPAWYQARRTPGSSCMQRLLCMGHQHWP